MSISYCPYAWNQVVKSAPFRVKERGWGEFDLKICLHFVDPAEKPFTFAHELLFVPSSYEKIVVVVCMLSLKPKLEY